MKVIDLLNKIANGRDIPEHIKIRNYDWYFYDTKNTYGDKKGAWIVWDWYVEENRLNDEVEIIEEDKKIEKLPYYSLERIQKAPTKDTWFDERVSLLEKRADDCHEKINEIIDFLESEVN